MSEHLRSMACARRSSLRCEVTLALHGSNGSVNVSVRMSVTGHAIFAAKTHGSANNARTIRGLLVVVIASEADKSASLQSKKVGLCHVLCTASSALGAFVNPVCFRSFK